MDIKTQLEDNPALAAMELCHRCGTLIGDAEYTVTPEGAIRHQKCNLWVKAGYDFSGEVMDGLENAGAFHPDNAMREWMDFCQGSDLNPFTGGDGWADSAWAVLREAAKVKVFRTQFAKGYRAGMRSRRIQRHLKAVTK
jgi:hypothetical protein